MAQPSLARKSIGPTWAGQLAQIIFYGRRYLLKSLTECFTPVVWIITQVWKPQVSGTIFFCSKLAYRELHTWVVNNSTGVNTIRIDFHSALYTPGVTGFTCVENWHQKASFAKLAYIKVYTWGVNNFTNVKAAGSWCYLILWC